MGIYLNPGNDAFCISVNDDIYVDKSGMIAFVNSRIGKSKRFICVSRPRRFGKSMQQLCYQPIMIKVVTRESCLVIWRLQRMNHMHRI